MKTIYKSLMKYLGISALAITMTTSCVDYLDKAPEVNITEADIFSKFLTFQGYVEECYQCVCDVTLGVDAEMNWNLGDDVIATYGDMLGPWFEKGDYWKWGTGSCGTKQSPYYGDAGARTNANAKGKIGYWGTGWWGIRTANIALKNLGMLVGTQEERDLIEGQAKFFRGYLHFEILRAWGGVPYIDSVFAADDILRSPRLSYLECANRISADLQRAAQILPASWDETTVGQATVGANTGRVTKGAAYAYLGLNLLYAASPLMNGVQTGAFVYNEQLCQQAAAAFYEVIKLADQQYYALQSWADYYKNFYSLTISEVPTASKELIFNNPIYMYKRWNYGEHQLQALGGWGNYASVTANYIDLFGMDNGLPIGEADSGYDPSDPWVNRDPRFYYSIVKDGDRQIVNTNNADTYVQFFEGGRHGTARGAPVTFGHKKFRDVRCNQYDNAWAQFFYEVPQMRLAEIYIDYAEAVNEAWGPTGSVPGGPTAIAALNIVRNRAGVPDVDARFLGSKEAFREIVRQERAIELCFEGHRWNDIRRWYVAHLPQYKEKYILRFPQDHSSFTKQLYVTSVFDMKHYWLPFMVNQVTLYPEFQQNPGW
jgi:starch-binding outer membrane protein, SusD/RagB family